ncbi:hypothetical protein O3P69_003771 [Scylla paramamosain]|uniref:Uncharacterized protein n=1 Tax=Scylla paramamosain TaxID=85552 RepID=A0AAW0UF70_SCYPA
MCYCAQQVKTGQQHTPSTEVQQQMTPRESDLFDVDAKSHRTTARKSWATSLNKPATVSRSGASGPDMSGVIL